MYIHICGLRSLKTYEKGENRMMTISKDQAFELKVWDYIPEHIGPLMICKDIIDSGTCLEQIENLILFTEASQRPGFYQLGDGWGIEIPVGLVTTDSTAIYHFIQNIDVEQMQTDTAEKRHAREKQAILMKMYNQEVKDIDRAVETLKSM